MSLASLPLATRDPSPAARRIGRLAIRALHAELAAGPKPGLVSPLDNGAHRDMDLSTFMRSLFALRFFFAEIAQAGADRADFAQLRRLGIEAERRMLLATGGVNTHRGAVFTLGLLAAAAGRLGPGSGAATISLAVGDLWGPAILAARPLTAESNGLRALSRHGGPGAREEAAGGYPTLVGVALPALRDALARGAAPDAAFVHTLFAILAVLNDTNLLNRGGPEGLAFVQHRARAFMAAGGVLAEDWRASALAVHHDCVRRHLSPGGAADLLAAAIFLHELEEAS